MLLGIKVLDLSRVLAGPLCTMMLGDMGADVLKVERPGSGDDTRGWGPPFDERGESAYFLSVNRNKLGLTADLADPGDRELLARLAADADVLVENFRPGTLERHGLGRSVLCARHPRLVWCTITGFGPGSERPGYDFVVQAECGWMAITGERGGAPLKHGVALADVTAGKDAAIAILAALVARGSTGRGRHVEVSLTGSATAALVNVAQNELVSGAPARRWGNAHANLVPYQLFQASDRGLVIAVGNDAQWTACAGALALPLADDDTLRTNAGRLAARDRVTAAMAERLLERPAAEWQERLVEAGVPCGLVRSVTEVLASTDASAVSGLPPSVPGEIRRPPPRLGEHAARVRELGWAAFG
ncbi:MAG: L-carnitine dehydratase/bile acid-inducible protein [Gemmatimonadetes bacterium]|jgi:crotonobetainyl-CoA:carnitine CoA-transferase CaiB-like acyl-CoA transferase|nr:L-carnitine dehydratase/bile acid-inducible protein [Gemmatimonadota bacterium]